MSSSMSDRYDTVLEKNLYTNRKNKTENEKKKKKHSSLSKYKSFIGKTCLVKQLLRVYRKKKVKFIREILLLQQSSSSSRIKIRHRES